MVDHADKLMGLFALRHRLEKWLDEGQGLLQIIDSLIPSDNSQPPTTQQMEEGLRNALFGEHHGEKIQAQLAERDRGA